MGKSQTQQATQKANDLGNQAKNEMSAFQADQGKDLDLARQRRDESYNNAVTGLKSQSETGGYDAGRLATIRGNADNLAKTGGYDMSQVDGLRTRMSNGAGGMDPNALAQLRQRGNAYMDDGGYDMGQLGKVRSGYEGFMENGGFDDAAKTNYLNRATSGVTNTYNTLQQQQAQARAKTGGLGSGGSAAMMARQLGQAQADSTNQAQMQLNQQINANKLSGIGGLQKTEADFAGARGNAFGQVAGMEQNVAAGNRSSNEQLAKLEGDLASGIRSGGQLQAGIEGDVANGRNQATQGMIGMFTNGAGQVSDIGDKLLKAAGMSYTTQAEAMNALTQLSKNPGLFQTAMNNIIGLIGATKSSGGGWD